MHSITLILPLARRKWKIIRNRALYPAIPEYLSIIRHFQRTETRSIILSRLRLFIKKAHAGVSSSHLRAPSIYASEYINRSAELQPKKGDPFFKTARARVALRVLPRMRARARPCRFIFSPGDPFFSIFRPFPSVAAWRAPFIIPPVALCGVRAPSPLYPVTADEKSPFHSRMNARGRCGGTIEVARIHKRRREAKPTMDREISTRIVSIAVGPQSHLGVSCPARRGLSRGSSPPPLPVRCPRPVTMGLHRYAIDTRWSTYTEQEKGTSLLSACLLNTRALRG